MAEGKSAADKSKIADVAHPGKTPPTDSAKPIIITNRPVLKDPMVVEDAADKVAVTVAKPHVSKVLTPERPDATAEAEDSDDPKEAANIPAVPDKADKPATSKAKTAVTPPKEEKSIAEAAPKTDDQPAAETDTAASKEETDETKDEGDAQKAPQAAPADLQAEETKRAEHEAAILKLAESKQYYLPINSVEKRHTRRIVLAGLVIAVLLALAWVDIALDAGLIHLSGIQPLTHFFST